MSEGELNRPWVKWLIIAIICAVYVPTSLAEEGSKPLPISKGQTLKALAAINHTGDSFLIKTLNPDETSNMTDVEISDIRAVSPNLPGSIPARDRLAELVVGKSVTIHVLNIKKFGPNISIVGRVYVDDTNVAETLVREGHAWVASGAKNPTLLAIEKDAKARKMGLWGMTEYQKEAPYDLLEHSLGGLLLRGYFEMLAGWRTPAVIVLLVLAAFVFWRGARRVRALQAIDPKPPPDFSDVKRLAGRLFLLSFCVPALLVLAYILWGILFEVQSAGPGAYVVIFILSAAVLPPFGLMGLVLRAWVRRIGKRGYFHFSSARYTGIAAWVGANAGVALLLTVVPGEAILIPPFLLWPVIFVSALFGAIALALFGYLLWTLQISRGQKSMS